MRTKRALMNSISSLFLQIATVICGFILPRMILTIFGSEANGAVSSIAQFLGYISLLEAGVGGVTRAALYKPLADKNYRKISGIANATQGFFKKIAYIFLGYTLILSCCFRFISKTELSWLFTATLVIILAASTFAQYYFGLTYSLILQADQKNYIPNCIQIGTVLLNTIISVVLMKLGCSFHIVKLVSAFVYIIRPLLLNYIVNKKYKIDKNIDSDYDAINQRWSGLGHHLAFFIHNNTDIMVITMTLGLRWVSVYSIYYMIIGGVKNIVNALIGGSEAAFGNMIAKNEKDILNNRFHMIETLTSIMVVTFFSATMILLFDFVKVYTSNIKDINYVVISLGVLFVISEALHCIKQTYHSLVLAAGHYKETQTGAFIEAAVNLVLSFVFVWMWGISGVLAATIVATTIRNIDYVFHLKKTILFRSPIVFFVRQLVNVVSVCTIIIICRLIPFVEVNNYLGWVLKAIPVFIVSAIVTLAWNLMFYKQDVLDVIKKVMNAIIRK